MVVSSELSSESSERLNHLMVLHIYQDEVDKLDLRAIGNEFIGEMELRNRMFGHFN